MRLPLCVGLLVTVSSLFLPDTLAQEQQKGDESPTTGVEFVAGGIAVRENAPPVTETGTAFEASGFVTSASGNRPTPAKLATALPSNSLNVTVTEVEAEEAEEFVSPTTNKSADTAHPTVAATGAPTSTNQVDPVLQISPGKPECPCIDSSSYMAEISDCRTIDANTGLEIEGRLYKGVCYPKYFGANTCAAWDMVHTPECMSDDNDGADPPAYCTKKFCYVDPQQCRSSRQRYYKTDMGFGNLFYSYSTCGSSAQEWLNLVTIDATKNRTLVAAVPKIIWPLHYKEDLEGNLFGPDSPAIYNESIPWRGHLIEYFNAVVQESNIKSVKYVHRSEGSKYKSLPNSFTQSVSDVEAGIVDLAISTYWVTTERLAMSSFTTPVTTDEFRLWIPQPSFAEDESISENVRKILQPFSPELWFIIFCTVITYAVLSAIISPDQFHSSKPLGKTKRGANNFMSKRGLLKLTDSLHVSFLELLGGGVDPGEETSLSQKFLNLGFALSAFITVTAYTANLAAFLTLSNASSYLSSLEVAIADKIPICAPYNVKQELQAAYPNAKWVFSTENSLILQAYDQGLCQGIVQGWVDIRPSPEFQEFLCTRELVRVGEPVIHKLVAFPAQKELVAGISHWIVEAETKGILFDDAITKDPAMCNLDIQLTRRDRDAEHEKDPDLRQLKPSNMLLANVAFAFSCVVAVTLHIAKNVRLRKELEASRAIEKMRATPDASEEECDLVNKRKLLLHPPAVERPLPQQYGELDSTIENAEAAMEQFLMYHQTLVRRLRENSPKEASGIAPPEENYGL